MFLNVFVFFSYGYPTTRSTLLRKPLDAINELTEPKELRVWGLLFVKRGCPA